MITGNEPVMPARGYGGIPLNKETDQQLIEGGLIYPGITIRQLFAMKAMASLAPHHLTQKGTRDVAEMAVDFADALINELNKPIL